MSMLEDTQSGGGGGDGYKTPNSLAQTISGQMSDQFALAVLRLQHSLDETMNRLNKVEDQLKISLESISRLENQTFAKQPVSSGFGIGKSSSSSPPAKCSTGRLIRFLSNMNSVHWFYLSYPILIYVILNAIDRRRRARR